MLIEDPSGMKAIAEFEYPDAESRAENSELDGVCKFAETLAHCLMIRNSEIQIAKMLSTSIRLSLDEAKRVFESANFIYVNGTWKPPVGKKPILIERPLTELVEEMAAEVIKSNFRTWGISEDTPLPKLGESLKDLGDTYLQVNQAKVFLDKIYQLHAACQEVDSELARQFN